ncbi:hypothetical protein BJV82DRAFT_305675 [Fennellomyces sp. T-0311]|nr:hypothetical protein BJV82DRAFT_305675 [Fennellomyces sp. T-0311]
MMTKLLTDLRCPMAACKGKKSYRSLRHLRRHIRNDHKKETVKPFGVMRNSARPKTGQRRSATRSEHEPTINNSSGNTSGHDYQDDMLDYGDTWSERAPNFSPTAAPPSPQDPDYEILTEEQVGTSVKYDEKYKYHEKMQLVRLSDRELDMATFAVDAELSQELYARFVQIIESFCMEAYLKRKPLAVKYKTLQAIKDHVTGSNPDLTFHQEIIDVYTVPDFPKGKEEAFLKEVGGPLTLEYRDIHKVCEKIFSDPILWKVTKLNPCIVKRGGERVYTDLYSSDWWIKLQKELPKGAVVLAIMLASDETVITGNQRQQAWPLYLKLGNTLRQFRDKSEFGASKLLAYFPYMDSQRDVGPWFAAARRAVFHYCLSRILRPYRKNRLYDIVGPHYRNYACYPALATYTADYPEQCLLAGTKQGPNTNRACPSCITETSNFHLPCSYENNDILRTPAKMIRLYSHGKVLRDNRQKGLSEEMCKKYSVNLVSNAFWTMRPNERFNIYEALVCDDLHQLGGIYTHLLTCIHEMIKEKHDPEAMDEIRNRFVMGCRWHQLLNIGC